MSTLMKPVSYPLLMKIIVVFVLVTLSLDLVMASNQPRAVVQSGSGGRGGDAFGKGSRGGRGGAGGQIIFQGGGFNEDDIVVVQQGAPGEPGQGYNGGEGGQGGEAGGVWVNGKKIA